MVKELLEQSLRFGRMLDSDHLPLQHFFIVLEHVLRHGLKPKKVIFFPRFHTRSLQLVICCTKFQCIPNWSENISMYIMQWTNQSNEVFTEVVKDTFKSLRVYLVPRKSCGTSFRVWRNTVLKLRILQQAYEICQQLEHIWDGLELGLGLLLCRKNSLITCRPS